MSAARGLPARVIVAVGADASSELPIDIAQYLLRDASTELLGLFIEDRRLFEHAESALAREVVYSGHARALDTGSLERRLRVRATEARQRFEVSAAGRGLRHAFQVLRGDPVGELLRAGADADALVVGFGARGAPTDAWPAATLQRLATAALPAVLFAREGWQTGRGIVVAVECPVDATTPLTAGIRLAQRSGSALTLLLSGGTPAERRAVARLAGELAAAAEVELRAWTTAELTIDATLRSARGARLLVLAHRGTSKDAEGLAAVLTHTALPLLVVAAVDRTRVTPEAEVIP